MTILFDDWQWEKPENKKWFEDVTRKKEREINGWWNATPEKKERERHTHTYTVYHKSEYTPHISADS